MLYNGALFFYRDNDPMPSKCTTLSQCLSKPISCETVRRSKRARAYCRSRRMSKAKRSDAARLLVRARRRALRQRALESYIPIFADQSPVRSRRTLEGVAPHEPPTHFFMAVAQTLRMQLGHARVLVHPVRTLLVP